MGKRKDAPIFRQNLRSGTDKEIQQSLSIESVDEEINSVANQWGCKVVEIAGDGNCFFTSVTFQVLQLLDNPNINANVREHLYSLGISPELSISGVSEILSRHVVDEWTGPFSEDYQQFIGDDVDFFRQAHEFLTSGSFAADIGDLMPLGLSNVLQIPIFILSTQNLVPFNEIYPLANEEAILLTYNHVGPGHYNVLVQTFKENEIIMDNIEMQNHNDDQKNTIYSRGSCRCGINIKPETEKKLIKVDVGASQSMVVAGGTVDAKVVVVKAEVAENLRKLIRNQKPESQRKGRNKKSSHLLTRPREFFMSNGQILKSRNHLINWNQPF